VSSLAERVAQAESANARQELTSLAQAELALRQDLALVTGWSPDAPPRPKGSLAEVTGIMSLPALIALASEQRPDLAVLDAAIAEARAQIRAADRDKTPEPIIGVTWTRESSPAGGDPSNVVIATLGLPLPFFSNNEPARAEARAQLELALAGRARAEAEIAAEVTRAYRAATAATRRLAAFGSEVLPRFEENLGALKRAYELGEIDILGLASGRERFLNAQRDGLSAQEDYFTALAELEHAVGVDVIDHLNDAPKENP
jgi:outer membrane protein TolC